MLDKEMGGGNFRVGEGRDEWVVLQKAQAVGQLLSSHLGTLPPI